MSSETVRGEYRYVLEPISIGGLDVPNRIVRTAHATGLAMHGAGDDFVAYHSIPARSGVGLTIFEAAAVHPNSIGRLRFEDDLHVPEYARAIRRLRKYPMKLFQQLNHVGRAFPTPAGDPPWSASAIPSPRIAHGELSQLPIAITPTQIEEVVDHFASAARTCGLGGNRRDRDQRRPWLPDRPVPVPHDQRPYRPVRGYPRQPSPLPRGDSRVDPRRHGRSCAGRDTDQCRRDASRRHHSRGGFGDRNRDRREPA